MKLSRLSIHVLEPSESTHLLSAVVGAVIAGRDVLVVGCGAGYLPLAFVESSASHVVAIDINPDAAATTSENSRSLGFDIEVGVADIATYRPERDFDVLVANPPQQPSIGSDGRANWDVWNHDGGPQGTDVILAILEAAAVLVRPGGSLFMTIFDFIDDRVWTTSASLAGWTWTKVADEPRAKGPHTRASMHAYPDGYSRAALESSTYQIRVFEFRR